MMSWGQRLAGSSVWTHLKILTEAIRDEPSSKPPAHSPVTHGAPGPWKFLLTSPKIALLQPQGDGCCIAATT